MSTIEKLPEIIKKAESALAMPAPCGCFDARKSVLAFGDNLDYMKQLLAAGAAGELDFIYVDPPFFTNEQWKTSKGADAYSDKWNSLEDFLLMLSKRLVFMRELLADTGMIAVHLDWHAVHYVKLIMDELFGTENLVNELIWTYKSGGAGKRSFAKKHDTILLYSKTRRYYFCPQKEKSYNREGRPYHFRGIEEFEDERGWYTMVNCKDVINIDMVGRTSKERCGYPTQKPLKLLELLIESCCPAGGIAADFFCGSASTAVAANKKGRSFLACDFGAEAIELSRARLDKAGAVYEFIKL